MAQEGMLGEAGGFMKLLGDPNFQSLLAGMGTQLDPEGVGGAIGRPTQQLIQSLATQKATSKAEAKREQWNKQILSLLGGLTPKETAGPTSMKIGPDSMTLDITPPTATNALQPLGGPGAQEPTAPGKTAEGGEFKFTDIIPF